MRPDCGRGDGLSCLQAPGVMVVVNRIALFQQGKRTCWCFGAIALRLCQKTFHAEAILQLLLLAGMFAFVAVACARFCVLVFCCVLLLLVEVSFVEQCNE